MADDIVERLGQDNDYLWFIADDGYPGLRVMSETDRRQEAADEIKRLRAEHNDLRVLLRGRTAELQAEVERLRAENDAYRQVYIDEAEFLEAFANWDGTRENLPHGWKWEQWGNKSELEGPS